MAFAKEIRVARKPTSIEQTIEQSARTFFGFGRAFIISIPFW